VIKTLIVFRNLELCYWCFIHLFRCLWATSFFTEKSGTCLAICSYKG